MTSVLFVLAVVALGACGSTSEPTLVCDGAIHTALRVSVRDAQTGTSISALSTIIASRRGGQTDSLVHPADSVAAIGDLAGTYDLLVKAPGFADWTKNGVVVEGDLGLTCQPLAVRVDALLQAAR